MNLQSGMTKTVVLALLLTGALAAPLHAAQPGETQPSSPGYEVTSELQRYQQMGEVMEQMQGQMKSMRERLSEKNLSPKDRAQIASQMKRMGASMRRMSGLIDRPTMGDAEFKKQMAATRKEMAAMQMQRAAPGGNK